MVAYLYRLPGWLLSPDDKPTYETFNKIVTWSTNQFPTVQAQVLTTPTLSTITVQSSIKPSQFNTFEQFQAYNFIKWGNNWYQITECTYVSDNNQVIEINGTIDLYLTWIIQVVQEGGTLVDPTIVYFNQKHLNRFIFNTNNTGTNMVLYQYQFYLMNVHDALKNVGSKRLKKYYSTPNYTYKKNDLVFQNVSNFYNYGVIGSTLTNLEAYPIVIWKVTADNKDYNGGNSYPFPFTLGQVAQYTGDNNQPPEWYIFTNQVVSSDYYTGIYLFPTPLCTLFPSDPVQAVISVSDVTGQHFSFWPYYDSDNDMTVYARSNQYYVLATQFNASTINDGSLNEPAILNFNHANVRMYGQDNTVNLTSFNYYVIDPSWNTIINQLYLYLGSFCITVSPPNMTLTNIPFSLYSQTYNTNALGSAFINAWNYNSINDAIFSIIMKAEAPSTTNAWSNYIANNKNNYEMGLNIAQLMAQNAQASVKMANATYGGSIASYDNVASDIWSVINGSFGTKVANTYNAGIESNTIAPNDANIQQDKLRYLQTGMKADYSRVSNLRVSASSNINTLFDSSYIWIYEYIPQYEQIAVTNYYALNGYLLERWDSWGNWNNRIYCNYIKCSQWCNAMGTYIPLVYRSGVDHVFNVGFRVWSDAAFNGNYASVPYSLIYLNSNTGHYNNTERNQNNNEVCYLCNVSNEDLLNYGNV